MSAVSPVHASGPALSVATPAEWTEIDLQAAAAAGMPTASMGRLDGLGPVGVALRTDLLEAVGQGILFAAMVLPGDGASQDFSVMTVSLRQVAGPTEGSNESCEPLAEQHTPTQQSLRRVDPTPSEPEPVVLPCGVAARSDSYGRFELPGIGEIPALNVDYAVLAPDTTSAIVLSFTTIAPTRSRRPSWPIFSDRLHAVLRRA